MHFERGFELPASRQSICRQAANQRRSAALRIEEAVGLSRRGLELLERLPRHSMSAPSRNSGCTSRLGVPLIATEGYAAPDVGSVYLKARVAVSAVGRAAGDFSSTLGALDILCAERQS